MTQDGSLDVLEVTGSTIVFYTGDSPHEVKGLESLHPVKYRQSRIRFHRASPVEVQVLKSLHRAGMPLSSRMCT